MAKCNIMDPPLISEDVICLGMQQWQKKTLQTSLCRLLLASTIYNVWEIGMKLDMKVSQI
jgi:hypothetical protein